MFWLFIQLALSSALFFQKLGKFVAYCFSDSHKGPQSFLWTSTRLWKFFIVYEPQPHLDGVHTVFGKTDDIDVVLKLTNGSKIIKATLN